MRLHVIRMGQGAPVVLLHGLFGSANNWGRVQRSLAEAHEVLAMDARNHGGSPHNPDTSYAAMAADVAETLAAEGIGAAPVVGHSMGGKIAMRLALSHPEAVARLLVADVSPVPYRPHFRGIAAAMQAVPLRPGLTRAEANAALDAAVPDSVLRGFLLLNLRFAAPVGWRIGLDQIAAGLPAIEDWDGAGTYDGPVLVLRGERSDYVLPEHHAAFRTLFPRVRFVTLKGAGHWLHADAPEAFIGAVRAFLG